MDEKTVELVEKTLGALSEKLGQGADHFWPVLVRQQVVEGYVALGFLGVIAVMFVTLWVLWAKYWSREDDTAAPMFFGSCFFLFFMGIALANTLQILNPEYYALMDLLKSVK